MTGRQLPPEAGGGGEDLGAFGGYQDVVFVARDADPRLRQECLDAEGHVLPEDFVGLEADSQRRTLPEKADAVSEEGEHLGELVSSVPAFCIRSTPILTTSSTRTPGLMALMMPSTMP